MSKKLFWVLLVSGLVVFIGGPLLVQYIRRPIGTTGNGDWLGFWGSYLGVIPSGLIAYAVARYQIDHEKSVEQKKQLENGLPYVKVSLMHQSSSGETRIYSIGYEIKAYDGNPLIFKCHIKVIRYEGDYIMMLEGLEGEKRAFQTVNSVELYEVSMTMFNGVKVFVTNNNSAKELVHLYTKKAESEWEWYGIQPTNKSLTESIKKAKVAQFD